MFSFFRENDVFITTLQYAKAKLEGSILLKHIDFAYEYCRSHTGFMK